MSFLIAIVSGFAGGVGVRAILWTSDAHNSVHLISRYSVKDGTRGQLSTTWCYSIKSLIIKTYPLIYTTVIIR